MLKKPSSRGQTHVGETGWTVSWQNLLDLVRTNKIRQKNKTWIVMETQSGTWLPESVADTPDTEDLPAGEALHLGIPLRWTTL